VASEMPKLVLRHEKEDIAVYGIKRCTEIKQMTMVDLSESEERRI